MKKKEGMNRRDFLSGVAGAAMVGAITTAVGCGGEKREALPKPATVESGKRERIPSKVGKKPGARVVLVRHEQAIGAGRAVNPEVLAGMIDDAVTTLFEAPDPESAWSEIIKPSDTVGVKSNSWRFLPTPPALEQKIVDRVISAGVDPARVAVDDRGVLGNQVFRDATALVNVRTSRTHHWAGVGSCIKNYIMFSPEPSSWHDDSCANLAGVWDLPIVKGKTRLNVLVMLTPLFHGKGPHHYQVQYTWEYKGLIVGTDPVAVDATGVRILEAQRRRHFGAEQPFSVPPKHIAVAEEKYKLGVADPARIELVKIGWDAGALI